MSSGLMPTSQSCSLPRRCSGVNLPDPVDPLLHKPLGHTVTRCKVPLGEPLSVAGANPKGVDKAGDPTPQS